MIEYYYLVTIFPMPFELFEQGICSILSNRVTVDHVGLISNAVDRR